MTFGILLEFIPSIFLTTQSQRIYPVNVIRCVLVVVDATKQAYWVLTNKAAGMGIVVAKVVVVQAAFFIKILPLKAYGVINVVYPNRRFAKAAVLRLPDNLVVAVGYG